MTSPAEQERAAVVALIEAARECADDLEVEVKDRWGYDERLAHKLKRDMRVVHEVRAAIATLERTEHLRGGE